MPDTVPVDGEALSSDVRARVPCSTSEMTEQVRDAGDLGCGNGLAAWFRDRMSETPNGVVLCSLVYDPAARVELPALARLMGQRVVSVEAFDERLIIKVEKIK